MRAGASGAILPLMPQQTGTPYTCDNLVRPDGSVAFRCAQDAEQWKWLELPPQHPIVVMTQNYWTSVGASAALGALEHGKWSALTWTDWTIGERHAGRAVRGTFTRTMVDDKLAFETRLFDAADRLIVTMRGRGVIFRNRDFEGWRGKAKSAMASTGPAQEFTFADPALVGAAQGEHALISPLNPSIRQDRSKWAHGMVTPANGLPPASRYLDGSGDHVNATHLVEAGRQFAALATGDPAVAVTGGEARFMRYVELASPFRIALTQQEVTRIDLAVTQGGHDCATITLRLAGI